MLIIFQNLLQPLTVPLSLRLMAGCLPGEKLTDQETDQGEDIGPDSHGSPLPLLLLAPAFQPFAPVLQVSITMRRTQDVLPVNFREIWFILQGNLAQEVRFHRCQNVIGIWCYRRWHTAEPLLKILAYGGV